MEERPPFVDILLATYNGENFLREQLDSVFRQTYPYFKIIIRDDGSTDHSPEIIKSYQQQYPDKITVLQDNDKNLGAAQNFARLMLHSTADYISFCDQDDIWLPEKLEVSLKELRRLEQEHPGKPGLVYSDMKLIDDEGKLLFDSEWEQLNLDPRYFVFHRLLIQNIPHGCTMIINRQLKDLALPISGQAILHDHWIAIVVSLFGVHQAIREPTMLLRFHAGNATRRLDSFSERLKQSVRHALSDELYEKMVELRVNQARAIKDQYVQQLSSEQLKTLDQLVLLGKTRGFRRKWIYLKNGFFRTTFRHTLKMILRG